MDEMKELMDKLREHCRKKKISVNLEAYFKKGKDKMQYLWRV